VNNIYIIDNEDFNSRFPYNDNFDIDEMDENLKNYYLKFYSLYMNLFIKFLIKRTSIGIYDKCLSESKLNFICIERDNMDIYQKLCADDLKYFYVRNNLYLNRLTKSEFEYLKKVVHDNQTEITSLTEKFIENTYKKVIFEDVGKQTNMLINYGPESPQFFAPNNALVIGIRYDEFNYNGMTDSEWDINYNNQLVFLEDVVTNLSKDIKKNFDDNTMVIKYDDFSIKKKNIELKNKIF